MFHRTERLLLRPVFFEDWQAIHAAMDDFGVVSMLARAPWPYGEVDAREFVLQSPARRTPRFMITLPGGEGSAVIGCIGMDASDEGIELGYWIARNHWGQGYATEAGRAAVEIARMLGHTRLLAGHATDNPASGRVLSKLGFEATGEIRNQFSRGRDGVAAVRRMALQLCAAGCDDSGPQLRAA